MQASEKQFAIVDLEERKKSECAWAGVPAFSRHSLKSRYTCIGGPMSGYAERARPLRPVVRRARRDFFRHWRSEQPEESYALISIPGLENLIEVSVIRRELHKGAHRASSHSDSIGSLLIRV